MPYSFNPLSGLGLDQSIPLDGAGKIPSDYLPSYVDDVVEYANLAGFPATGETGKIYVAIDTGFTYRWSGSVYIQINSLTGTFAADAGTAAAPSISIGTADNGLYAPAEDQVAISTNGTGRLFVDANGQVGIGGSPQATLSVFGNTRVETGFLQLRTNNKIYLNDSGNTNFGAICNNGTGSNITFETSATERLRLTSDGKLGLGTSSPSKTLDIAAASGTVGITSNTTSAGNEPTLTFTHAGNNSYVIKGGNNLEFASDNGANPRMTLTTAGSLGIGTNPVNTLDVNGTGLFRLSGNSLAITTEGGAPYLMSEQNAALHFGTNSQLRATIDSSGRLLVGTSSIFAGTNLSAQFGTANTSGSITSISVGEGARIFRGRVPASTSALTTTTATFQFSGTYGAAMIEIDIVGGLAQVAIGRYLLMVSCDTASGQTAQLTGGSSITTVLSSGWNAPVFTSSGASATPTFTVAFTRSTGVDTEGWDGYLAMTARTSSNSHTRVCSLTSLTTS